jgi:hypothetical protein
MEFVTSGSEHEGHRPHHTSLWEFQPSFRKIPHKTLRVDQLELLDLPAACSSAAFLSLVKTLALEKTRYAGAAADPWHHDIPT